MGSVNHQLGIAEETTYGTGVTVDRWLEILSESLTLESENIVSQGMAPGRRFPAQSRVVQTRQWGEGDIEMEVSTTQMGLLFKHMLGTDSPDVVANGTLAFDHTYILGGMNDSLTVQKGVQRVDDPTIVEPYTFVGCKVTGWSTSIAVDEILSLNLTLDARDVLDADNDAEVLTTAAYPSGLKVFHFAQGTVLVDDVAVANVSSADISATNNLTTERYHLGSSGRKAEPRNVFGDSITGSFTADFGDPADLYNAYHDNTTVSVELEFVGDEIEAGVSSETVSITLGAVKLEGTTPAISNDLVTVDIPFTAYEPDTAEVITIFYTTTDSAV